MNVSRMKIVVLLLLVFTFLTGSIQAIERVREPLGGAYSGTHYGVRGGLTINNQFGHGGRTDWQNGFMAGGMILTEIHEKLVLEIDLVYNSKGYKENIDFIDPDNPVNNRTYQWDLDYIEAQFLFKALVPVESKIQPSAFVGFAPGILVSAGRSLGESTVDVEDLFQDFDLGVVLGLGFDFGDRSKIINVDVRYQIGLFNVLDSDYTSARNQQILITTGLAF